MLRTSLECDDSVMYRFALNQIWAQLDCSSGNLPVGKSLALYRGCATMATASVSTSDSGVTATASVITSDSGGTATASVSTAWGTATASVSRTAGGLGDITAEGTAASSSASGWELPAGFQPLPLAYGSRDLLDLVLGHVW